MRVQKIDHGFWRMKCWIPKAQQARYKYIFPSASSRVSGFLQRPGIENESQYANKQFGGKEKLTSDCAGKIRRRLDKRYVSMVDGCADKAQ